MRYGENPHQAAAFYREGRPAEGLLARWTQLQGKELSYNNIADADAAWECVKTFDAPACVIVKHANPCGVAVGAHLVEAYGKAWKTDPTSAYGGILAFNRPLDEATARQIGDNKQFVEVLIAPGFTPRRAPLFAAKQNLRVLEVPLGTGSQRAGLQARRRRHAAADARPEERGRAASCAWSPSWRPRRRRWTTCCSPGRWPSS